MKEKKFSSAKHEYNPAFDRLLHEAEHNRLSKNLSKAMTRPAYAYTSLEQKNVYQNAKCEPCVYFRKSDSGKKKECQFPWDDPEDYDLAVFDYLPCKEGKNEKD